MQEFFLIYLSDFCFIKNKSVHIAEKLSYSYGYLPNRFSENACISIENFIILQKAEYAKELIIAGQHTFTEIAHRLNYSSAAHLNAPFKKTTGLTPSSFRRLYPRESSRTSGPATGKSVINKEYLNVAVADPGEDIYILFKNAFQEMKMEIRIQSFHSGNDLMNDLENKHAAIPDILFLRYDFPGDDAMECLQKIKADPEFDPVITVLYASAIPPEEEEYIFVCGAHVVMQQPDNDEDLKKVLTEFMMICWQFHTSGLSRNNFIMKV